MKEMVYKNKFVSELLDIGTYNGYQYMIVSRGLHPCAYVKIPECHKYYGLNYDDIPVDCHCGLTYSDSYVDGLFSSDGWWIGWDYGHCMDYSGFMMHGHWKDVDTSHCKKWTTTEILKEMKQVIDQLKGSEKQNDKDLLIPYSRRKTHYAGGTFKAYRHKTVDDKRHLQRGCGAYKA